MGLLETLVIGSYIWSTLLAGFLYRAITSDAERRAAQAVRDELQALVNQKLVIRIERLEERADQELTR